MDTVQPAFDRAALTKFLEPFTTPKAQQAAVDALEKQGRLNAQAFHYLGRVVEKNQQTPALSYTPPRGGAGPTLAEVKQQRIKEAHRTMLRRVARIERAYTNQIGRIKADQMREIALQKQQAPQAQQPARIRTLTREFNRRR